jgi:hypothetical protein
MLREVLWILNALAPTLLVIVTLLYVIITRSLASENKKLREEQYRPRVTIGYEMLKRGDRSNEKKQYVHFVVRNIGMLSAFNIKFKIESDLAYNNSQNIISQISFVDRGIPYLTSNQDLKQYLFNANTPNLTIKQPTCKGTVSYSDTPDNLGRNFKEEFTIDFSYIEGSILIE